MIHTPEQMQEELDYLAGKIDSAQREMYMYIHMVEHSGCVNFDMWMNQKYPHMVHPYKAWKAEQNGK